MLLCVFSASTVLLSSAPAINIFPMALCYGALASSISAATAPPASNSFPMALSHGVQAGRPAALPRLPCQQQTSFGGEEYSGLASNLAHLGRIC